MFNRTALYNTTIHRVFLALHVAAGIGAIFVVMVFVGPRLNSINLGQLAEWIPIYVLAHLIWFFGLALIGGPIWIAMHKFGLRHWAHAGLAGGVAFCIASLALMTGMFTGHSNSLITATGAYGQPTWQDHHLTADGWAEALRISLVFCPLGVLLGIIIWRIAYRRAAE